MTLQIKLSFFLLATFLVVCLLPSSYAIKENYQDLRCKCTCSEYIKYRYPPKIYTENVLHEDCNCLQVVVPNINGSQITKQDIEPYCLHCECKYEVRSTKTMQFVVYLFIALILILVTYMLIILIFDPIYKSICDSRQRRRPPTEETTELMSLGGYEGPRVQESKNNANVFQRLNLVQDKWKKQVKEQRSNVFDRQDILQ